jgi:hypothetical protein
MNFTTITATQINKWVWRYIDAALRSPVKIKRNGRDILITLTPQDLEDMIDGALASSVLKQWKILSEDETEDFLSSIRNA